MTPDWLPASGLGGGRLDHKYLLGSHTLVSPSVVCYLVSLFVGTLKAVFMDIADLSQCGSYPIGALAALYLSDWHPSAALECSVSVLLAGLSC